MVNAMNREGCIDTGSTPVLTAKNKILWNLKNF
jgi:hypothetical protein